jgi:hypothetical protein
MAAMTEQEAAEIKQALQAVLPAEKWKELGWEYVMALFLRWTAAPSEAASQACKAEAVRWNKLQAWMR